MYQIKIYDGHPDQGGKLREIIDPMRALEMFDQALNPKEHKRVVDNCLHCGEEYMSLKAGKQIYCPNCSTPKKRRKR